MKQEGSAAIQVNNVSKAFKLPHEKHSSIKGMFINLFRGKRTYEKQEVLNNISFEIKKGEFFGIVGRNGSGKSTLLKLLAGIYEPDKGQIKINGKLTPFIELGVGFNPELTGRENVFLNGALLGFNRHEMDSMYDEIVEFAELEKFMDQKLKNYSSGMQVRLAFSIAIRVDTDILVLDEVLAVGDEKFQTKCIDYFQQIKKTNKTVVFVSHDMDSIKRFCDKAVVIHEGQKKYEGDPNRASLEYTRLNFPELLVDDSSNNSHAKKDIRVLIKNKKDKSSVYQSGEDMLLEIGWNKKLGVKNAGVAVHDSRGTYIFGANTILDKISVKKNKVSYKLNLNLGRGKYTVQVGLFGSTDTEKIAFIENAYEFSVVTPREWEGITNLKHEWMP